MTTDKNTDLILEIEPMLTDIETALGKAEHILQASYNLGIDESNYYDSADELLLYRSQTFSDLFKNGDISLDYIQKAQDVLRQLQEQLGLGEGVQ